MRSVRDVRRAAEGVEGVEVDFGAGPRRLPAGIQVLDLRPSKGLVPAAGAVDWTQLSRLPSLLTVEWAGPDRGLTSALADHPGVRLLEWNDATGELDLRGTHLGTVRLDGAGLRAVRLPRSIETVLLRNPAASLEVEAPDDGRRVDLRLFQYGPEVVIPAGLRRAPAVWLGVGGEVSAAVLAPLTELRDLRLTFETAPGVLSGLEHLAGLPHLHTLTIQDAYGLGALPDLPALRHLALHGVRRTTATVLRQRYRGGPVELSVHGAKSEPWLAQHMDNPFRDWAEDSKTFGRAACTAYSRAWKAVDALPPDPATRLAAGEQALRTLLADLNALHTRHELIGTARRDQARDAFRALAAGLPIPQSRADTLFDEGRRF